MIDVHMHIGKLYVGEKPLTPRHLLRFMDANDIEKAILLPIESPEEAHYYVSTEYVMRVARKYPDRFVPGCNVDPRIGTGDNNGILRARLTDYRDRGCKAYGEAMSGLAIDDPALQRVYRICGELRMPVIYHIDGFRNVDEKGFPRFERMLRMFPETVFVGHAQHFWAEISGDVTEAEFSSYPNEPITPGGAVPRLMETYPNLFADLSAGSAYNALTRDPPFGYAFLERFQDRLFFGTDVCRFVQPIDVIPFLKEAREQERISEIAFEKITRLNAMRVFGLK
ncbi:MAG TPA: amidohydrolase family protein [Candidatus Latescibacteria bacterium]|nr:amidohydrolase family protein [Candidatus Latescibacterota bacterium]HQK21344.1 amidohydrolase family protein [Candidatus Latescibacterota bacterium]